MLCFQFFKKIFQNVQKSPPEIILFKTYDNNYTRAYWLDYEANIDTLASEIASRYYFSDTKIRLKCINVKSLKIDALQLGIPKGKKLEYYIEGTRNKITYDNQGNLVIAISRTD
jgi:hypothetical protein